MRASRQILLLCFALLACLLAEPQPGPNKRIMLLFDYPADQVTSNLWVNVYHSPAVTGSFTSLAKVPMSRLHHLETTNGVVTFALRLTVRISQEYYYATVSNAFWRVESPPSNLVGTDPMPAGVTLRIALDED